MSNRIHTSIKSYNEAMQFLGTKKERPIAHNTRIENMGDVIMINYHGNPIVNFYCDGSMSLSSCGWKTPTTKERLNWSLPEGFSIYQESSIWYLVKRDTACHYIFADGITISEFGNVAGFAGSKELDNTKNQIRAIKKYVDGFIKSLLAGESKPDNGDCWYCLMKNEDGKTLGDISSSNHIKSHIEESYYVGSLLINAFALYDPSMYTKGLINELWQCKSIERFHSDILARDVRSSLTRYLKHKLGIAQ